MSAASRLAAADAQFVQRDPLTGKFVKRPAPEDFGPQLGKNRAGIAGGLGIELAAPVKVGGIEFTPEDGAPWASPIGAALASELAS